ncbi:hypothetical protein ACTXT7_003951 [Hymenolepis weldensis]
MAVVTEAERLASRQLIPIPSPPVADERMTATHEHATDNFQPQADNQTTTDAEKDSEQAAGHHTTNQLIKGFAPNSKNEIEVTRTFDNIPDTAEPSDWTLESIRQTISTLSLVHKQTLTEILHLLPRLNDNALALLVNEIANRRRRLGDLITPASPKSTSPSP